MEKMRTIIVALIAFFLLVPVAWAQQTPDMDLLMGRRAQEKVGQMNDYISQMASKKKKTSTREYYREQALHLFIGNGYEYTENGETKTGVLMQTTSLRNTTPVSSLIRDYFSRIIRLKYSDVEISATEIAKIKFSNLYKVDDNLWECTCEYDQSFVGMRDGRPVYKDITTKRIKCYIIAEQTEDGVEYIVLLGDVEAIKTRRG